VTTEFLARPNVRLDDRYTAQSGEVLMSGIQALVRLTLDQRRLDQQRGLNTSLFVSGYEGSPLGGLDMEMNRSQRFLDEAGVIFRAGLNEELAATSVSGTQSLGLMPGRRFDGVTGCWYGKNPGLDRAADAIRHGNISGTAPLGGAVAWIGDDPASKSSTVPSSCVATCRGLTMPVLSPATVEEIVSLGLHSIAMSRHAGLWVGTQIVTDIADATDTVNLDRVWASASKLEFEPRTNFAPVLMLPPANLDAELDLLQNRLLRASRYGQLAELNALTFEPSRPRLALVGVGLGYQAIVRALGELGIDAAEREHLGLRLVRISMPWPLESSDIQRLCLGVEKVLVVEDKLAFVEVLFRDGLYRQPDAPLVLGKNDEEGKSLLPLRSFLTADDVARALGRILDIDELSPFAQERLRELRPQEKIPLALTPVSSRTPFFCSGCPHNTSTRASTEQLVGLGIGCHSLAALDGGDRRGTLTGVTQMGGEGAQWLGLAPFTDDPHFIQNLGDGTFHHSGSLAIRAAVAANVTMTYKLMYNNAVAMTGGQQPLGKIEIPDLTRLLEAEGVSQIVITTPEPSTYAHVKIASIASVRHRDDFQQAQLELAAVPGVTVLIHDDRCAAEKRRLRKRNLLATPAEKIVINERVCEGCGDCGEQSTCLSLVPVPTAFGRKTQVHQSSCNYDKTCLKGDCPSFLLVTPKPGAATVHVIPEAPVSFPLPKQRVGNDVLIRMPGVGGTGVVTVSALLQMAAHLDGKYAAGLDQIGLAQKGGPVVSDVRFGDVPLEGQLRASARSADLILGFDVLGAATADTLAVASPRRTIAVLNTSVTPTAEMVTDTTVSSAGARDAVSRINSVTRSSDNVLVDAGRLAEQLFQDHFASNLILVGVAFQQGYLPLSEDAIEQAIRLNGAAVQANIEAFRWGRALVALPEALTEALTLSKSLSAIPSDKVRAHVTQSGIEEELLADVAMRYAELVAYQNDRHADQFLADVLFVQHQVRERLLDLPTALTATYARGLFKLMAYKDEYEVARLHLIERERYRKEFGEGVTMKVLLHPPTLRSMGMKKKIHLGRSAFATFSVLRSMRRLRGTRFDPFGYASLRKLERSLVDEYKSLVEQAIIHLRPENESTVVALAELPDVIRGYEHIKVRNVEHFRRRAQELLTDIQSGDSQLDSNLTH